jgi:hypothetical protein
VPARVAQPIIENIHRDVVAVNEAGTVPERGEMA